tara:strand:- start:650 stop:1006 length:357 start_codon:yes stop_codon:yes gene_type:complete
MKPTGRIFFTYLLIIIFMLVVGLAQGQITVVQFNAEWNSENTVKWCTSKQLSDCKVSYIDIGKNPKAQKKHSVVVVPTIIILNNGEEVKRYQADLSFKITAKREDVQEIIDEQLMSDF